MKSPRCEVDGCAGRVDVRLTRATAQTGIEDLHYCAAHAPKVLDDIMREFARERNAVGAIVDRCAVHIELVVCDGRDGFPCLIFLRETGGPRRLAIPTGRFEAWILSWEMKGEAAPSLGTHRAMASVLRALGAELREVAINDASEGDRFHAELHVSQGVSQVIVDVRPSDALTLAVVCNVPAYVESSVWQKTSGMGSEEF